MIYRACLEGKGEVVECVEGGGWHAALLDHVLDIFARDHAAQILSEEKGSDAETINCSYTRGLSR
jgi:hypothetical protein